ncbi:MAG: adenylosuccinate synthase [Chitinivibrionales bacterium]|nr:adenylosuccinate synthase [Chitinivibrionales bacterium]
MSNIVIVGAQWGDEGKAKVVDYLTEFCDLIVRYQGGANAGHTVIVKGEKFVFHLVPSGIVYPAKICVVGSGVVFDAEQFLKEIDELAGRGVDVTGRLFVSDCAHLVFPFHRQMDGAAETSASSDNKIGTTGRGIGPAYSDKALRCGIRVGDLTDWDYFAQKLSQSCAQHSRLLETYYSVKMTDTAEALCERYRAIRARLLPFITDTSQFIYASLYKGKQILFEGAQGSMLDIDHGTYPFVTSSNTIAGGACTGAGVGPTMIRAVVGIVKAYTTRVGNGPFPTELSDSVGETLRKKGGEFGATTGRPRRCGWFDSVVLRKSVELNGLTHLALTKLDVLSNFSEVKICSHYEVDGKRLEHFPSNLQVLGRAKPIYETLPGWNDDLTACKSLGQLPTNAITFINRLQKLCHGIPLLMVSVGPERSQTIEVTSL